MEGCVYVNEQLTKPAIVDILKREQGKTLLKIVLIEGRNRQIRKVAAESGRKVIDLNRVAIATIKLVSLTERSWRELDISEWENLLK